MPTRYIVIEPNGYNKRTKKSLFKKNKEIERRSYPFVIYSRNEGTFKVVLDKIRGEYLYSDSDRVFGLLTEKELKKFYVKVPDDKPALLESLVNGFKESLDSYLDNTTDTIEE